MSAQPFRIEPQLPVMAVKTYQVAAPLATHWRRITCEETGWCPGYETSCAHCQHGWEVHADERTDLGLAQATYIRQGSGRTFTELRGGTGLTVFRFEGHQRCFAAHEPHRHMGLLDKTERFIERDGDWRGNPTGRIVEHSPGGWVDSFGEHQQRLAERLERG